MKSIIACIAALGFVGVAEAHIVLAEDHAGAGGYYAGYFRVGHGCEGRATTSIRVSLPESVITARPQAKPGWTVTVEKAALAQPAKGEGGHDLTERVAAVTWTGTLDPDFFDEFGLLMKLPDAAGALYFPTVQRCGDAEIAWTDIPAAGQAWHDVPHPAPVLTLAAASEHDAHAGHDMADMAPLRVEGAWSRAAIAGGNGAAYARVVNDGDAADRLIAVKGDAAEAIEIHEMTTADGVMQMRKVEALDVPAKGSVELAPGGLHIMLIGLKNALKEGDTLTLTFVFEKAGEVSVAVPVGKAGGAAHDHH